MVIFLGAFRDVCTVHEKLEWPGSGDPRVELSEAAGCAISGVRELWLAPFPPFGVNAPKGLFGQKDFPTNFELGRDWRAILGTIEAKRDVPDRLNVGGDILAPAPISAGGCDREIAGFIDNLDCEAIEFRFGDVGDRTLEIQESAHPLFELPELLLADGVLEREHWVRAGYGFELCERRRTDATGRGVVVVELGMEMLQLKQASHPLVILGVGNLRVVELVVASVGTLQLLSEVPDLILGVTLGNPSAHSVFH
jgi:hypothetical protein